MNKILLLALFGLSAWLLSCEQESLLPAPPPGSYVLGEKRSDLAFGGLSLGDGTWLLAGGTQTSSNLNYTPILVLLDADGREIWTREYGELGENGSFQALAAAANGGYILLLVDRPSNSSNQEYQTYIVRLDADFNPGSPQRIDRQFLSYGFVSSGIRIVPRPGGGYLLPNGSQNEHRIRAYDANGNPDGEFSESILSEPWRTNRFFAARPGGGYLYVGSGTNVGSVGFHGSIFDENFDVIQQFEHPLPDFNSFVPVSIVATGDQTFTMLFFAEGTTSYLVTADAATGLQGTPLELGTDFYFLLSQAADSTWIVAGGDHSSDVFYYGGGAAQNSRSYCLTVSADQSQVLQRWAINGENTDRWREIVTDADGNVLVLGNTQSYGAGGNDILFTFIRP